MAQHGDDVAPLTIRNRAAQLVPPQLLQDDVFGTQKRYLDLGQELDHPSSVQLIDPEAPGPRREDVDLDEALLVDGVEAGTLTRRTLRRLGVGVEPRLERQGEGAGSRLVELGNDVHIV